MNYLPPFFLQNGLHATPQAIGATVLVRGLVMGAIAPLGGYLADRWGRRPLSLLAALCVGGGLLLLLPLDTGWSLAVRQCSGVILFVTAGVDRTKTPNVTAIGAAFGAMEALMRCLATDLGPSGVRVVGIHSGPMGETRTIQQGVERIVNATGVSKAQVMSQFEQAGESSIDHRCKSERSMVR